MGRKWGQVQKRNRRGREQSQEKAEGKREKVPEARIGVWMEGGGGPASFSLAAHLLTWQALYQPPYSV